MRAAVYHGPGQVDVEELPTPALEGDDVLIAVEACGVCGSDVASYLHGHYAHDGQVLGHEISGLVVAAGPGHAGMLVPGTRVAVRPARACGTCPYCRDSLPQLCGDSGPMTLGYGVPGGYADLVHVPAARLGADVYPVPANVAPEDVMWCEPLAVAVRAVRRAGGADTLIVLGGGSIGLCVAAAATALGSAAVIVSEPRAQRRAAAESLGARCVEPHELGKALAGIDPARTVAIDTSGSAAAIAALPPVARIVVVGLGDSPLPWPGPEVVASFAYTDDDFATAVALVVDGRVRLGRLVTHRFSLADTGAAIRASAEDPDIVKAAVVPNRSVT